MKKFTFLLVLFLVVSPSLQRGGGRLLAQKVDSKQEKSTPAGEEKSTSVREAETAPKKKVARAASDFISAGPGPVEFGFWNPAVNILESKRMILPWAMSVDSGVIYFTYLTVMGRDDFRLNIVKSENKGANWSPVYEAYLGQIKAPPVFIMQDGTLEGVYATSPNRFEYLRIEYITAPDQGVATFKHALALKNLPRIDSLVLTGFVRRGAKKFFIYRNKNSEGGNLTLLESSDNARTWSSFTFKTRSAQRRGARPLMYISQAMLHVIYTPEGAKSPIHLVRYSGNAEGSGSKQRSGQWTALRMRIAWGHKYSLMPVLVAADQSRVTIVLINEHETGGVSELLALNSENGGISWGQVALVNPKLLASRMMFPRIARRGGRVAIFDAYLTVLPGAGNSRSIFRLSIRLGGEGAKKANPNGEKKYSATWANISPENKKPSHAHWVPAGVFSDDGKELYLVYVSLAQVSGPGGVSGAAKRRLYLNFQRWEP